jgi:DNA invertase Pin-like site-specific DNA recombinase
VARIGYARVSTADQDLALQRDALAAADCDRVFEDRASGAKADRPGLAQALSYVRSEDVLVVWKLDRLGRSMSHLITAVSELESRGVGLRSLTEQIDTTTPGGRLIFHVFGALGQFERDLIRERTRAGLKAAEARGRRGGRKPVVTEEKLRRALQLIAKGLTTREAAARIKVGKTALYNSLQHQSGATFFARSRLAYVKSTFVSGPLYVRILRRTPIRLLPSSCSMLISLKVLQRRFSGLLPKPTMLRFRS